MGSNRKLDDFTSEITEEDIEEQILEDPEEQIDNPSIKQFYDAIPEISKLAKTLISPKPMRTKELKKVLWRCPEGSRTAKGVLTSHRAKKFRAEINAGCGFDSPASKPYRPFGETCLLPPTCFAFLSFQRQDAELGFCRIWRGIRRVRECNG